MIKSVGETIEVCLPRTINLSSQEATQTTNTRGEVPRTHVLLFLVLIEDGRTVLGADVALLPVEGGRIVHPEEETAEVGELHLLGVELHVEDLGMACR